MIEKGDNNGSVLLLVAGIQGDEAGGYMSANLLAQKYDIHNGKVLIVPNLNGLSILKNSRGVNGDMNRKFKNISKDDPDYEIVTKIKEIILNPNVDIVLHLHDGSGFYRDSYIDELKNPARWGQSVIIDMDDINSSGKFGDLQAIASTIADGVNKNLLNSSHKFHIKNTKTDEQKTFEQQEMAKTLTYFAVLNGRAALANESSKELSLEERVYYHLSAIEKYMDFLGIKHEKKFSLSPKNIKREIYKDQFISIDDGIFFIPLEGVRDSIGYVPMRKTDKPKYKSSSPLIVLDKNGGDFGVYYGAYKLSTLKPQFFEYEKGLDSVWVVIDGVKKMLKLGEIYETEEFFEVQSGEYRVNAIGFVSDPSKPKESEDSIKIYKKDFIKKYSIDKEGRIFRVEFYNNGKYKGMFLIRYKGE